MAKRTGPIGKRQAPAARRDRPVARRRYNTPAKVIAALQRRSIRPAALKRAAISFLVNAHQETSWRLQSIMAQNVRYGNDLLACRRELERWASYHEVKMREALEAERARVRKLKARRKR